MTEVQPRTRTLASSVAGDTGGVDRRQDVPVIKPVVAIAPTGFGFVLIDVGVADTVSDVAAANALLLNRYVPKGYPVDLGGENRLSPDAPVLIAKNRLDGAALATLTLRIDGAGGLIAEHLYPNEVARLRDEDCRLCEAVRFASAPSFRSLDLLRKLFDSAFALGRQLDRTDVLIEVTPRHAAFYKRILGFRSLGSPRHNPRVNTMGTLLHANAKELSDRVGQASLQGLALFPTPEVVVEQTGDGPGPDHRRASPLL